MAQKQIKDLPSTSTVNSTDVLAKETSTGTTNKIAISDFVINNLTSTSTTQALSAAQGKVLNDGKAEYTAATFTAKLYDLDTFKKDITASYYYKIGALYFMYGSLNMSDGPITFSTMLQIRNLPCSTIIGGSIYLANYEGQGGDRVIQTNGNYFYPRPNITGSVGNGWISFFAVGK